MSGTDTAAELDARESYPDGEAVPAAPDRRRRWLPYWTGFVGFLLGVLFWHFVGFWSFVSEVAFNGDTEKSPSRLINLETARSVRASEQVAAQAQKASATAAPKAPVPISANVEIADAGNGDTLSELLQCSEVRPLRAEADVDVHACPPLRKRLPFGRNARRADRMMDAREAADRLAHGWQTGVSRIETGSLRSDR